MARPALSEGIIEAPIPLATDLETGNTANQRFRRPGRGPLPQNGVGAPSQVRRGSFADRCSIGGSIRKRPSPSGSGVGVRAYHCMLWSAARFRMDSENLFGNVGARTIPSGLCAAPTQPVGDDPTFRRASECRASPCTGTIGSLWRNWCASGGTVTGWR